MRLSDDKVNHLSHVILKKIKNDNIVEFCIDENDIRLGIKEGLAEGLEIIDNVENKVKEVLHSYSRKIIEGSREWDVMFNKIYEEELSKLGPTKE